MQRGWAAGRACYIPAELRRRLTSSKLVRVPPILPVSRGGQGPSGLPATGPGMASMAVHVARTSEAARTLAERLGASPTPNRVFCVGVIGRGAAHRAFSSTALCLQSDPAPNVEEFPPDEAADALGALADPVVYGWWPSNFVEIGLSALHDASGLPWWQCIAGVTLALRTCLLPLAVFQMQNAARLALTKPEMELITKRWKALGGYAAPPQATQKYQEEMKAVFAKHKCSPGRSMIGIFVQAPLFMSFFFALQRMSHTYPSFQSGGTLW